MVAHASVRGIKIHELKSIDLGDIKLITKLSKQLKECNEMIDYIPYISLIDENYGVGSESRIYDLSETYDKSFNYLSRWINKYANI